jgi:hypothetical protein
LVAAADRISARIAAAFAAPQGISEVIPLRAAGAHGSDVVPIGDAAQ